jgi:hypothetical protein
MIGPSRADPEPQELPSAGTHKESDAGVFDDPSGGEESWVDQALDDLDPALEAKARRK